MRIEVGLESRPGCEVSLRKETSYGFIISHKYSIIWLALLTCNGVGKGEHLALECAEMKTVKLQAAFER